MKRYTCLRLFCRLVTAVMQHEKVKPELMFQIRIAAAIMTSFCITNFDLTDLIVSSYIITI